MKDALAIILGAGFSFYADLPLVNGINSYFLRNNADNLLKFSSGEWKWIDFANGTDKNNGKLGYDHFAYGYILNKWVSSFLEHSMTFTNYEDFYQYVKDKFQSREVTDKIYSEAFKDFKKSHTTIKDNPFYESYTNAFLLPEYSEILNILNHLISDLLYFRKQRSELLTAYYSFNCLLQKVKNIDIVTLNHDFLLEALLQAYDRDYTDGFSDEKSPLQIDGGKGIKVFNGIFSGDISIIKLHGSIDVYKYLISSHEGAPFHPAGDYLYFKTHNWVEKQKAMLVNSDTGKVLQNFHSNITPQFITGTRKSELIANDPMYATLYSEFDKRIHKNRNLLIIGYSYGDQHVNDKIISAITSGKRMKIVNVNPGLSFPFKSENIEIDNLKYISELNNSLFQNE